MKNLLKFSLILLLWQAVTLQSATTVTNIAAGSQHDLFIKSDGSLWAMGYNAYGQLGDGTFNSTNRPEQIVSNGVVAIACGGYHSLLLKSDGSLWAMGDNRFGQLGDGTTNNASRPEQIVTDSVVAIAAGGFHSMFIKSNGSLWVMGDDQYGELGDGNFMIYTGPPFGVNKPEQILSTGVVAIAAGDAHSLFVTSDNGIWAMGQNFAGQLGNWTYNSCNTPQQLSIVPYFAGVALAAGGDHSLYLFSQTNGGVLWAWGYNYFGQLGDGTFNNNSHPNDIVHSNVVSIAAGSSHSLFIKTDGSLWAMGDNSLGQLGDGTMNATNKPEQIIPNNVVAVAAGNSHSLFLKADGSLWAMGNNIFGDGFTNSYSLVPEQIVPSPKPLLTGSILSKTNLQFKATCQFGGVFYLLAGTNISQPLSQWTRVWTNSISNRRSNNFIATITNAVKSNAGKMFYILQSK